MLSQDGFRKGRRPFAGFPRAEPFAGCQGRALTGSPEGRALWRCPLQTQHGGADDAGVGAELGDFDAGDGHGLENAVLGGFFADGVQEELAGLADAAAQDDDLGIEEVDDGGNGLTQVAGVAAEDLQALLVAFAGGIEDHLGVDQAGIAAAKGHDEAIGVLGHGFARHADDGGGGGVALQAAAVAAGAGFAVDLHDHVAYLAAHAVEAAPHLAADHDASAHAGAQGEEHAGIRASADAGNALGQTGHGGVVIDEDGLVDVLLEGLTQGNVLPAQVGAEGDNAGLLVGNAGNANADGGQLDEGVAALFQGLQGAVGHGLDLLLKGDVGAGNDGTLGDDLTLVVHNAHLNAGAANVDTNVNHSEIPPK